MLQLNRRALLALAATGRVPAWAAVPCPALLTRSFPRLQDEAPQPLCQYAGKVLLVVNTASYCGYTSQYEGLEALHARLSPRGLVVLGFPTNDFGQQEPGNNRDIADFCQNTFGVKFPMFAKTTVKGPQANSFIAELAQITGKAPGWNFHKYLISRDARRVKAFESQIAPGDARLLKDLDAMLTAS